MKKIITFGILFIFGYTAIAQDLPQNPEPGKCYVRCKTPDLWKNQDVTLEISPAYKRMITHPATFKTVTERVLIKEAGSKLVIVPAVWGTKTISYTAKEDSNKLRIVKATFSSDAEVIETKAASARWEMSEKAPDCESEDPNDCRYWCYKPIPAKFVTIPLTKLDSDATTTSRSISGYEKSYTVKTLISAPTTRTIEIPAVYGSVRKVVLVKDAWQESVAIDAKYKTVTKEILINKGGLTTWKEVECTLVSYNPLPINWNLGSATLTSSAKRIIDSRLLPILKDGVAVEIASHTDSRGTRTNNQDLSERRAQAVTSYLISKGINASQLVAKGYGESKLLNRCKDGTTCNEQQHRINRRTEFRVINQK